MRREEIASPESALVLSYPSLCVLVVATQRTHPSSARVHEAMARVLGLMVVVMIVVKLVGFGLSPAVEAEICGNKLNGAEPTSTSTADF